MTIKSAIVDNEVFLQGEFLSIGINKDGTLGARKAAPSGFFTDVDSGLLRQGLFADFDGIAKGAATTIDDVLMFGRTIEGFNIGYKTGGQTYVQSNQSLTGFYEIAGKNTAASNANEAVASWNGQTTEKLAVSQKITLSDNAKFFRIDVTLTNNSSAAMTDLRYMRTADADQEGQFATTNKIVRQGDDGALVASYLDKTASFFLFSDDDRAVASTYGFVNSDPYAALAYDKPQAQGYTKNIDETVNLTIALGTLAAGASETITLYMGVTDNLAATILEIENGSVTPPKAVDLAPVVANDTLTLSEDSSGQGNVLTNDRDPEGAALVASLKSGPANGTLTLASDGSFVYTPKANFFGTDSFSYAASDGSQTAIGTVKLTVQDVAEPTPPPTPTPTPTVETLLTRAGTQNGSAAANEALSGPAYHNTFFFDVAAKTGYDTITNFGNDDVLVVNKALYDGNGDGIIGLTSNKLSIDAPSIGDIVKIVGTKSLRYLGADDLGNHVYADGSVRPKGAVESTLADNSFAGDATDLKKNVFFFDTALDIDLGADTIANFGNRDILVTTAKLTDANSDGTIELSGGKLQLTGVAGAAGDLALDGEAGSVALSTIGGAAAGALEFDGSVVRNGTTYYVYSLDGSAAGTADLGF